jgi:hypothetical protein
MSDKRQINFDFPDSSERDEDGNLVLRCDGCNKLIGDEVPSAPILRDNAWAKLSRPDEYLCAGCMFQRAIDRDFITLRFGDLKPVAFNLFHRPRSWFDLFLSKEPTPPDLSEWAYALAIAEQFSEKG